MTAVSGDTTDALLDAALDLVAEALRAVLRTVVIGHDMLSLWEVLDATRPADAAPTSLPATHLYM